MGKRSFSSPLRSQLWGKGARLLQPGLETRTLFPIVAWLGCGMLVYKPAGGARSLTPLPTLELIRKFSRVEGRVK